MGIKSFVTLDFPLKSWNKGRSICFFGIENNMMSLSCGNDNFLPDLGNEKDSHQIVFEQKGFRSNEKIIHINQAIINWFKYPVDNREYPKVAC